MKILFHIRLKLNHATLNNKQILFTIYQILSKIKFHYIQFCYFDIIHKLLTLVKETA